MNYPQIDPVIFQIGPLAVRWYGMMYLLGFIGGYFVMNHICKKRQLPLDSDTISDLLFYGVLGVVLGGRFGYTLIYNFNYYIRHPLEIFYVWEGGMSFHGGTIGVVIALFIFGWRKKLPFLLIADVVVAAVPVGLGLGRIGNFINGELWGRVTDVPWGIIFPGAGPSPRHPSQLYEAALEGLVLFFIIYFLHSLHVKRGVPAFSFLVCYGIFRFFVEFFRQPDVQLGFLWGGATMGQLLSIPMIVIGIAALIIVSKRNIA